MIDVQLDRALRPVGVLVGGSGRARIRPLRIRKLAALLKPLPLAFERPGRVCEQPIAGC